MAVVYIWRVVEAAYFQEGPDEGSPVVEAPLALLVPTWALVVANFYFGINASFTTGVATSAARTLFQMAP
jgi:multicomponent Na+:H+ antiporter subunit D